MNNLIGKLQKDLLKLQETVEKEGEVLIKKVKDVASKAAKNKNVAAKRRELEKLLQTQVDRFEPALERFYREVKINAKKYGIDLTNIEAKLKKTTKSAAARMKTRAKTSKKKSTSSTGVTRKAPAKKKKATNLSSSGES